MNLDKFTPDQRKAIVSEGSNILVSAGAGSGKTQVLSARVVYFVSQKHYTLDQFLILTFTKLAAAEMKDRIRKKLIEEGEIEAANQVDSANICTFDSYALNLVKKYHFDLKVSPNVSIIDKTIIDVKKRAIIDEIFEDMYKNRDEEFCKMIEHFCVKDDKNIRNLIFKVYDMALLEDDTDKYLNEFEDTYYSDKKLKTILSFLLQKIEKLRLDLADAVEGLPNELPTKDKTDKAAHYAAEMYKFVFEGKTYDEILAAYNNIDEDDFGNFNWTNKDWSEETQRAVTAFRDAQSSFCKFLSQLPLTEEAAKEDLLDTKPYAKVIIRLIKELDKRIKEYKDLNGVYEFTDIAKKALDLVANNEEVREEIKSSLKMIMIDEYQDTSSLQDNFIKQISDNNVYMVGDVKQSIYRFRNANVSIFIDKYKEYKTKGTGLVIDMNKNFRSRREVLDDINYIFKQIMTEKCGGADYRNEHMIQFGNENYNKYGRYDKDNHTCVLTYSAEDKTPLTEPLLIAKDIIKKMNEGYEVMDSRKKIDSEGNEKDEFFTREATFSDFCILMDRGGQFATYQKVFNDLKLPIYVENDEDISSNDIVLVLTNLLRMVNFIKTEGFDYQDEYFKKAWLSLARSFLFAYDDEKIYQLFKKDNLAHEDITAKIRAIVIDNYSASSYELFEKLVYELDIYSKCVTLGDVEKNHKYLDYFLSMFKSMSDLGYTIPDFISFMENVDDFDLGIKLSSTGTSVDSIRIMNIHKSKGLEFKIVYMPGIYKPFNRMDNKESYSMSKEFGLIVPKGPKKANIVKIVNAEYELAEDTSEKIRQLYVALTRTKEQLILLEQESESGEEALKAFKDDLDAINDGLKAAYGSYHLGSIDYDGLVSLLKGKGFEPTTQFISMSEEQRHSIPFDKSIEYFVEIGKTYEDMTKANCFHDMLSGLLDNSKFVRCPLPEDDEMPTLIKAPAEAEHKDLLIKSFPILSNINQVSRASKQLSLSANKEALDFGTKMHFLLETTDFNNPDLSDMDMNEKHIIERFLHSPFMSNIKEGKAYKEYEYHDDLNNVNGTIDLMVIYDDHIDVIDYKTKNIDDASYDKQIGIYMDYVQRTFHKKVNGYLYSLLTGEYKTYW